MSCFPKRPKLAILCVSHTCSTPQIWLHFTFVTWFHSVRISPNIIFFSLLFFLFFWSKIKFYAYPKHLTPLYIPQPRIVVKKKNVHFFVCFYDSPFVFLRFVIWQALVIRTAFSISTSEWNETNLFLHTIWKCSKYPIGANEREREWKKFAKWYGNLYLL